MLPQIPQSVNKMIQDRNGQLSTFPFPENIAALIDKPMRRRILQWMLNNYIWGQVQERQPFEATWEESLNMARATWDFADVDIDKDSRLGKDREKRQEAMGMLNQYDDPSTPLATRMQIADTVIFDAVDRLTNLSHFIQFKEDMPVRFEIPPDQVSAHENESYSPRSDLVKAANAWLKFNGQNQDVYRKSWIAARHYYTYGICICHSDFQQEIKPIMRRQPDLSFKEQLELTKIGITFDPISIRKIWLNWRLSVYDMDYQPCPFFFEEMPRFATVANVYDPQTNPMGYVNLDSLPSGQWLFSGQEMESLKQAYSSAYPKSQINFESLMPPEMSVELLWTYYPMLPLSIQKVQPSEQYPQGFKIDFEFEEVPDQQNPEATIKKPVPLQRYIMNSFGGSLIGGEQEIIRLQRNFYPNDSLPLYGAAHMPSLDDGAYSPGITTILRGHYQQICKSLNQFLLNKDWNNDPPVEIMAGSPAMTRKGINNPGARVPVNGPNDIRRREPFDTGNTTLAFLDRVREQAQTSSKSTDAILGKAMGSRTSATEASNVFQTAMSGVTTDVNLLTHDLLGGHAQKVWDYTGLWVDPDILKEITGTYGYVIKPEDFSLRIGLKWDTGSQFVESVTRQQNYQYLLQAFPYGDPTLNRAWVAEQLLTEWRFKDVKKCINDGGVENEIQLANEQACKTYLGEFVMIDPDQNHQIALRVKMSYLKDSNSFWNSDPQYAINGPKLVQQIQMHQQYIQLQMMQQMQQQQMQGLLADPSMADDPNSLQPLQRPGASSPASTAGEARQQTGE